MELTSPVPTPSLPRPARIVVVVVVVAAAAALAAVGAAAWPSTPTDWLALLGLAGAVAVSEHFHFAVGSGRQRLTYSVTDALWTAAVLLGHPFVVVAAAGLGVVIGQAVQGRPPVRVAFNAGQFVLGVAAAVAVVAAFGRPPVTSPMAWLAVALGMAVLHLLSTVLTAAVVTAGEGESFWRTALDPSAPLQWLGNLALGVLGALIWILQPLALPLLLVPLTLAFVAYRALLRGREERDAMRRMAREADLISRSGGSSGRLHVPAGLHGAHALAGTLNRMLERLDRAFQRERRFIRETSHELRTPITICRGHLELLGPAPTPAELAETTEIVIDELDRMTRIVDDMNTLARMEDTASLRREPIAVRTLVSQVAAKAAPLAGGRLRVDPVVGEDRVDVDSQRVTQALINLVANAVRHTPPGTPVELVTEPRGRGWRFTVVDHGPGLTAGEEEMVFHPFTTGSSGQPGNGLGLAIVQGIAEAHGGRAGVDNRPGSGATFWLEVPR